MNNKSKGDEYSRSFSNQLLEGVFAVPNIFARRVKIGAIDKSTIQSFHVI